MAVGSFPNPPRTVLPLTRLWLFGPITTTVRTDYHDCCPHIVQYAPNKWTDTFFYRSQFEKASVLLSDNRFTEALHELEELKQVAPREASVFFLMGRIYKKLGLNDQAITNFSTALDLKPASADVNLIKSAIEKLHVPDDSEDEDL
jgi:tetratricopeptide (TPR) repeat protein